MGILLAGFLLLRAATAHAYEQHSTHPALTGAAVDLYNRVYPGDRISEEERGWLTSGAVHEDTVPRSLNHLYDPVHQTGWTGKRTGWVPDFLTRFVALFTLVPDEPLPSIDWLMADGVQEAYGRYGGNMSWPAAQRYLANGDREKAYRSLGAALHLLQDAGVPEHARDDTHVHHVRFLTGDQGSPYEAYAARYTPSRLGLEFPTAMGTQSIPRYQSPRDYLADNAQFVANSFFSKDTVESTSFQKPRVESERQGTAYGRAADGQEVPLAKRVGMGKNSSLALGFDPEFHEVLERQFQIIAHRTVLLSVGMLRDFRESGVKYQEAAGQEARIFSIAGEVARVLDVGVSLASRTSQALGAQLLRGYSWLNGTFTKTPASNAVARYQEPPATEKSGTLPEIKVREIPVQQGQSGQAQGDRKPVIRKPVVKPEPASPVAECLTDLASKVMINEVAWMGTVVSPSDEWIELHNVSDEPVVTDGWVLQSSEGSINGKLRGKIEAGGYAVLERTDDDAVPGVRALAIYAGNLPNEPGKAYSLSIEIPGCVTVDSVMLVKSWPAGDAAARKTMERSVGGAWQTSSEAGGTPGRVNSPGSRAHEVAPPQKEVIKKKKRVVTERVEATPEDAWVIDSGAVQLSELQVAGEDAGDEWVELYNTESRPVSLRGWSLQYVPASTSSIPQRKEFPDDAVIPALGYYLVARQVNQGGGDGYRGALPADLYHRSFSLSGLGASIALVRGGERVASSSDGAVADWYAYPATSAGQSRERAAQGSESCLNPGLGEAGEWLGNGCRENQWHLRAAPEPQNTQSLPEPRDGAAEGLVVPLLVTSDSDSQQWVGFSKLDLGLRSGAVPAGQSWELLVLRQPNVAVPDQITTDSGLRIDGEGLVQLRYLACHGLENVTSVIVVPLNHESCSTGGMLSGAMAMRQWEDDRAWLKVGSSPELIVGARVVLERYSFVGGGSGVQSFARSSSTRELVVTVASSSPPGTPQNLVTVLNGEMLEVSWGEAEDQDSLDGLLRYEISVEAGESLEWRAVGRGLTWGQAVDPGRHTVAVRAVDEQGNAGVIASTTVELVSPAIPENLEHGEIVLERQISFELTGAKVLRGFMVWVAPEGGPYCCSRPALVLKDESGAEVARAVASRRTVDGPGEVQALFESPVVLQAGRYALSIAVAGDLSNGFALYGSDEGPYLRWIVENS